MLTLKRRRKRRVPPQRGRGAILGLFFCCAQCSILAVGVSIGPVVSNRRGVLFASSVFPRVAPGGRGSGLRERTGLGSLRG